MNPITAVCPNFFRDFHAVRNAILAGTFKDEHNPMDGTVYPAINKDICPHVAAELTQGLEFLLGRKVHVEHLFARAMFDGMLAANKIHSDLVMGTRYASQVYLSEHWPHASGTSFWQHKKHGMLHAVQSPAPDIDCNDLQQFQRVVTVQAQPNLLLAHRGDVWHLAEPIGGWGTQPSNARLVLTCFFNLGDRM